MALIPAGPKLREAKRITWPISQFKMSLVGFDHVFATAQPVPLAPDLTLKVISSQGSVLTGRRAGRQSELSKAVYAIPRRYENGASFAIFSC